MATTFFTFAIADMQDSSSESCGSSRKGGTGTRSECETGLLAEGSVHYRKGSRRIVVKKRSLYTKNVGNLTL